MWDSWSNLIQTIMEIASDVFAARTIGEGLSATNRKKKRSGTESENTTKP